ncbi:MAG: helix-turn-helix domain-containing protein [Paeniglutamicibacter terrestris]
MRSFASSGFSVKMSAAALHVHPNMMTYRLERWKEFSGWDHRTFEGLLITLLVVDGCADHDYGQVRWTGRRRSIEFAAAISSSSRLGVAGSAR